MNIRGVHVVVATTFTIFVTMSAACAVDASPDEPTTEEGSEQTGSSEQAATNACRAHGHYCTSSVQCCSRRCGHDSHHCL
jgi:hypothetical protein